MAGYTPCLDSAGLTGAGLDWHGLPADPIGSYRSRDPGGLFVVARLVDAGPKCGLGVRSHLLWLGCSTSRFQHRWLPRGKNMSILAIRGRVAALWVLAFGGTIPFANIVAGPLIELTSLTAVLLTGAAAAMALTLVRLPSGPVVGEEIFDTT